MRGRVQGVFFRAFAQRVAEQLGLKGYVRNRQDGSVEVRVEGSREQLARLLSYLQEGPPNARVDKVETNWTEESGNFTEFTIEY